MNIARRSVRTEDQNRTESIGIEILLNTLEFKEVLAARKRLALSLRSTGVDISVRYSTALMDALRNDSAAIVG